MKPARVDPRTQKAAARRSSIGAVRALAVRMARLSLMALFLLAGCKTAMTPGSAYRQTGRLTDLLAEPTFDVGAGPPEGRFYSLRVPHYNADGHGLFDVPVVFCEQMMFAPVWVFSAILQLTGSEPYVGARRPPPATAGRFGTALWFGRKALAWTIAAPGMACYMAGFAAAMAFDVAVHDAPVIAVGRPLRFLARCLSGR